MSITNLPMDLLRSFVTVSDLGGYTRAAEVLNRTQPAISLQMRRLEELLEAKLFVQNGKQLMLSDEGKALSVYARQILLLNDEAISQFRPMHVTGGIRIGLPTDFAVSYLQKTVVDFSKEHPDVDFEICCDLSRSLLTGLHADDINLTVALYTEERQQYLVHSWEEQPIWAMGKEADFDLEAPIPLVCQQENCEYRIRMTEALERNNRKWRIAYTGPDVSGVQQAVEEGFGVSALTLPTLTDGMRTLSEKDGFPPLRNIKIGLFYKQPRLSLSGLKLSKHIIAALNRFAGR